MNHLWGVRNMSEVLVFEWDEAKRAQVWLKHAIDFNVAIGVFLNPLIEKSRFEGEERWVAIGMIEGREIAVICTYREQTIRIITARRARSNERKKYHQNNLG